MSITKQVLGIAFAISALILVGNRLSQFKASMSSDSLQSDAAKLQSQPASPTPKPPPPSPLPPPRSLENGELLVQPEGSGKGKLTIQNGTQQDAVVKLIDPQGNQTIAAIYVRQSQDSDLENIPDGAYELLFAQGIDWDQKTSRFTREARYSKFEKTADFSTHVRTEGSMEITETSANRITLHSVPSGNAKVKSIDERDFEKYK